METVLAQHTSNDSKVFDEAYFQANQELLRESLLTDPSGGMYVVSELANAIHEGRAFSIGTRVSIAGGATVRLLGLTGAKEVHFDHFHVNASKGFVLMTLWEAPTITVQGTPIPAINRNRNSLSTATFVAYSGSTTTANGTFMEETEVFDSGGTGSNIMQGSGALDSGWVFKPNTYYMITITNNDTTAVIVNGHFIWTEREVV